MTMEESKTFKVALVGNPNSGKSTVFNQITGLRQQGKIRFPSGREAVLIDFPGTYSLHATSSDEKIVTEILCNPASEHFPDLIIYVADVVHLEKHLLLLTQLLDLGLPVLFALNMADTAEEMGVKVNVSRLSERLGLPVVFISGRTGDNIQKLLFELEKMLKTSDEQALKKNEARPPLYYTPGETEKNIMEAVRLNLKTDNPYRALLLAHHYEWLRFPGAQEKETLAAINSGKGFQSLRAQVDETLDRYDRFTPIVQETIQQPPVFPSTSTDRLDAVLTHRFWGPAVFFIVMLLVFQSVFDWSVYPMDWIEGGFGMLGDWLKATLPAGWFTDLLTDGMVAGLAGILVFVPQIALLFLLITILEEVGYMSRVVFMFDKTMRRFGMNGRSVVSLIGGGACAVPAIMSSRTIGNWQERLITTLVTPFISCSARIPVYLVLIGLAVPATRIGGFINAQSLVFGSMYALGVVAALLSGWAMKKWLGSREPSYLVIELPEYRMPHWKNVWFTVWSKVVAFVAGAGKIILIVSIALWGLSRFGPGDAMAEAARSAERDAVQMQLDTTAAEDLRAQRELEASYAGQMGKWFEPAIRPLGYDWKIGIALLTSFAAREVFTGTLAVLYNMGSAEGDVNDRNENEAKASLRSKMKEERFSDSGAPVYTLASALSLLVFYALAMQCMSTLAVVRRETGGWKWPLFQFVFMSVLAYVTAWAVFVLFS
jgi:ferrous iron transport protein B